MRVSIVAVGGACSAADAFFEGGGLEGDGMKAEESREEISEADQVSVMLSRKREGSSMMKTSEGLRRPRWRAERRSSALRVGPRPVALPGWWVGGLVVEGREIGVLRGEGERGGGGGSTGWGAGLFSTSTQAQDLDMVAQMRVRERDHGGGEEHSFVVWVGDQEADAFAAQVGGGELGGGGGEVPEHDEEDG